ncbi:helix-turn-helix domain-containing protein [Solirhodobacter olei]|uniref:helix-turn-helix domain-containing protein n=1 Tax=Solirhodobacter olei TaxID=2493082 RepID=UPI0019D4A914|nr:helix-turn-helix domain-containing protein [Solirhodobacter olei]
MTPIQRPLSGPNSPSDPNPAAEEDLWFLPGPVELEPDEIVRAPLPRADRTVLADPAEWVAAQGALAVPLARAATLFGALDERLRGAGEGARQRLALLEVAELSWHAGDRITPDRLALWVALRLAGAQDDAQALTRAGWAVRRMAGGPGPGGTVEDLKSFLGRQETGDADLPGRLEDWREAVAIEDALHPFLRAARGLVLWDLAEVSPRGPAATVEALVTAARLAAEGARGRSATSSGGAVFLPLLLAGPQALRRDGGVAAWLARWLDGAEQATLAALLHLDRLDVWRARAGRRLAGLSGRTPPRLADALAAWPILSAPMAEAITGASRAAVQRNLDIMAEAGLIRELTGQGRFRMWAAKM